MRNEDGGVRNDSAEQRKKPTQSRGNTERSEQ